jgi:hypothetical protein
MDGLKPHLDLSPASPVVPHKRGLPPHGPSASSSLIIASTWRGVVWRSQREATDGPTDSRKKYASSLHRNNLPILYEEKCSAVPL